MRIDQLLRTTVLLSAIVLLAALAPAQDVGPVASWDVADVAGDALADGTGNGHDMTLAGAATEEFMGRSFLRFGPDKYAAGPTLGDGWQTLTLVATVMQESDKGAYGGIICRDMYGGPAGDVFGILTDPQGNWAGRLATTGGSAGLTAPMQIGWHQLALTYDGEMARLYVDGQEALEKPLQGALATEPDTPLALGAYSNQNGWYAGGLAGAAVYDRALSGEELAAAWAQWQEEHPTSTSFSFTEAADLHVTDTRSTEIVNDAVDMINADARVAFSLWLGDLTQYSSSDEMALARMTLDRLRKPRYTLRGNHDQKADYYAREFGELNYTFEYAGWKFVMLDTNPGDKTPIDAERMQWLRDVLAETDPAQPLVLCSHHPMVVGFPLSLAGCADILALFEGHNLKAVLGAHFHSTWEKETDGVLFTGTSCLATTRTNHDGSTPRGYRLFHCTKDTITTEYVLVRDVKPEDVQK